MLDIKPLHEEGRDCFTDMVVSVAEWSKINYELAFVEAWNFKFLDQNPKQLKSIGVNIKPDWGRWQFLLRFYHGLQVVSFRSTSLETLLLVKRELSMGRPVIIFIDSFYCPWHDNYQKHYGLKHTCMVVGINGNNLFCVDSMPLNTGAILPIEDFIKGVFGNATFVIALNESNEAKWTGIIEEAVKRILDKKDGKNAIDSILDFSDCLEKYLNLKKEREGFKNLWDVPLFKGLHSICGGRTHFAKALHFLALQNGIGDLIPIVDDLKLVGSRWAIIRGMLIKGSMMADGNLIKDRAVQRIRTIAEAEAGIAKNLNKLIQKPIRNFLIKEENQYSLSYGINDKDYPVVFLNLTRYFNNIGFGSQASDCQADLSDTGYYFLKDDLPEKNIWKIADMKFIFPYIGEGVCDNISCSKQIIDVPPGYYSKIFILGVAEWGGYYEKMSIKYRDGEEESIPIAFTEWNYLPCYGEVIAWEGRGILREADIIKDFKQKVRLFARKSCLLHHGIIEKISLPDCPNMHIFAISLGKSESGEGLLFNN
jgi:hypothetical protein